MTRVLVFGAFDPLHEGHADFFRQARELGEHLTVIVARDSSIRQRKHREPAQDEQTRLQHVAAHPAVDEARLGNENVSPFQVLEELEFEIIALGYDQKPDEATLQQELKKRGKPTVRVVRLEPFHPERFKSTHLRPSAA